VSPLCHPLSESQQCVWNLLQTCSSRWVVWYLSEIRSIQLWVHNKWQEGQPQL